MNYPSGKGTQVTALNFGATPIDETITLPRVQPGPVVDMINETVEGDLSDGWRAANHAGRLRRKILPNQWRAASQRVAMTGAFQGVYLKRKPCPNPVDDDAWVVAEASA